MTDAPLRILLVEDNPGDARLLRELLRDSGALRFDLIHVTRLSEARTQVAGAGADVVLLDLSLPDASGIDTVRGMLSAAPDAPIIVLTGLDDDTTAVQAVQAGAQDFLVKGRVDGGLLARSIRYARERQRLDQERARLLRSEREARETAEAAVRAREEVLRVVAHDLGNSLSAMLVTASVLGRLVPEELAGGTARRKVENIRILTEQMQRLRQDLLDVAMLEAGQLSMERIPCGADSVVEQVLERYRPVADERSIELTGRIVPGLPPVLADEERLLQVMANLLTNALKFTPVGGRVEVGADLDDAGAVRLHVRDSGPGINPENLTRIFDRFWSTRRGNPTGAGLGLAIARGIVEAHGGTIRAESNAGEGSVFHVTLPPVPPAPEGPEGVNPPGAHPASGPAAPAPTDGSTPASA